MYKVKGIQCHRLPATVRIGRRRKKKQQKQVALFTFGTILSEHTYTRLSFVVTLVDKEFSSKYSLVGLITVTDYG